MILRREPNGHWYAYSDKGGPSRYAGRTMLEAQEAFPGATVKNTSAAIMRARRDGLAGPVGHRRGM